MQFIPDTRALAAVTQLPRMQPPSGVPKVMSWHHWRTVGRQCLRILQRSIHLRSWRRSSTD
jgi:hypothetical protein